MARRFDRQAATADARFERLEDRAVRASRRAETPEDGPRVDYVVSASDLDELHVTTQDSPLPDGDAPPHALVAGVDAVDALAEMFNARDLDGVLEVCAPDCEVPGLASDLEEVGPALDDLWIRRPTVQMTRMVVDDRAVGVLWERVASARWGTIGTVHVDLDRADRAVVLEFSDDLEMLDRGQPPPPDVYDPIWSDPDDDGDT